MNFSCSQERMPTEWESSSKLCMRMTMMMTPSWHLFLLKVFYYQPPRSLLLLLLLMSQSRLIVEVTGSNARPTSSSRRNNCNLMSGEKWWQGHWLCEWYGGGWQPTTQHQCREENLPTSKVIYCYHTLFWHLISFALLRDFLSYPTTLSLDETTINAPSHRPSFHNGDIPEIPPPDWK